MLIKKFIKTVFNHEVWMKCKKCGCEYDARKSNYCDTCGHRN